MSHNDVHLTSKIRLKRHYSIIGEPSKRPEASFSPTPQASQSASSTVAPSEDGLSKLFAGLMKVGPRAYRMPGGVITYWNSLKPPTTQTSVQQQHISPQQDDVVPTSVAVPAGQPIIPRPAPAPAPALATVPSPTQPTGNIQASASVPFSFSAPHFPAPQVATPASAPLPEPVAVLASAPAPAAPESAKYETADDLLASILGTAPPAPVIKPSPISQQNVPQQLPAAPVQYRQVSPLSYGSSSIHQTSLPVRTYTSQKQAYGQQVNEYPTLAVQQSDLTEANVRKSSKIGDATFAHAAQAAAANSASIPTPPMHALSPSSRYPAPNDQSQARVQHHARSCPQTSQYSDNQSNQPIQHAYQRTPIPSSYRNGAESRAVMAEAIVDATVQKEQEDDARVWGIELDATKRKLEFRRRLVDLMMVSFLYMRVGWEVRRTDET